MPLATPAGPEVMLRDAGPSGRSLACAVAISLLLHVLVIWNVMPWEFAKAPPLPQSVTVKLMPPPAPARVRTTKARQALPKLARAHATAVAIPQPQPEPAPVPGPPLHKMKTPGAAVSPGGTGSGGSRNGSVYAPPDYAEKVKSRVNAAIVYPADARRFLQQCWVAYTLTVDRNGTMLDYKIDNCGDDRLDAAAEAALIKGGPYPPPPDTGAASYEIHGAFVFTLH